MEAVKSQSGACNKVNILIPMNGSGSRFGNFSMLPKPLIKILDKEMIFWLLDNLDFSRVNNIIFAYTHKLDEYDFCELVKKRYEFTNFTFIRFQTPTNGAAETISIALTQLPSDNLKYPFITLDCDTFYNNNFIEEYQNSQNENAIFYFETKNEKPIFSYITFQDDILNRIEEKKKISNFANCGIFAFKDGLTLKKYANLVVSKNLIQSGELYISGIHKLMLSCDEKIQCILIKDFTCLGTPEQVSKFLNGEKNES